MNILIRLMLGIVLLGAGFAVGFPMGQYKGFSRGSEWAMVQADIVARESGVFMPIRFEEEQFHVVMRQPRGIYTRTRKIADQWDSAQVQYLSAGETQVRQLAYVKQ